MRATEARHAGSVDRVATVILGDDLTSWDQLRHSAEALAPTLDGASAVAVVADPTVHTITTILAAMSVGVPVVPIGGDAGETERAHVLSDSGADLLVERGVMRALRRTSDVPRIDSDAALVLYTSGTTGAPKGVPITRAAIRSCIDGLADSWRWQPDDLLVHGLPLYHVHGLVLGVLGAMQVGSSLHHTGRPSPAAYAAARGTLYFGVPTVWSRVAADEPAARSLSSARLLVSGSAALSPATFSALQRLTGHAPIERYGMTETLITVSARTDQPASQGAVGFALAGTQTRIVDDAGEPLPWDGIAIGDLQVTGPTVFGGYLNRPEASAASFTVDGWFSTGDVASISAVGEHRIVGRASTDLIKSGGYRIGAGEIEDALLSHPGVREAAVIGAHDDDLGQRIVAYVVADGCAEDQLITHVAESLAWHKRPRRVVFVDALPRNAMGKLQKARLADWGTP